MAAYTLAQHEYQVRDASSGAWGASRHDNMAILPDGRHQISGLTYAIPVGYLRVRVIAIGSNPPSDWLYNTVAFLPAAGGKPSQIEFFGDSLEYGASEPQSAVDPPTQSFPAQLHTRLGDVNYGDWKNNGLNGQPVGSGYNEQPGVYLLNASYATRLATLDLVTYLNGIAYIGGGINDLRLGGSVDRVYADLKAAHQQAIAAGWKTIAVTHTCYGKDANVNAQAIELDKRIRAGWKDDFGASALVDLGADAQLGTGADPSNNPNFSTDLVHLTVAGYGRKAALVQPAVEAVRAGQTYGVVTGHVNDPTAPPSGFTGWVAPTTGESTKYQADDAGWTQTANAWITTTDASVWADGRGVYTSTTGAVKTSPDLFTRSVKLPVPRFIGGGVLLIELVKKSDGSVVDSRTINQYSSYNSIGTYETLTAPALGVYFVRITGTTPNAGFGGLYLTRAALVATPNTDPPIGFMGLVAPENMYSAEYDATGSAFTKFGGSWDNNNSPDLFPDSSGSYVTKAGDYCVSKDLWCSSIRIPMTVWSGGGTDTLIQMVRKSDGVVVDSKTVNQQGPGNTVGAVQELHADTTNVYFYRLTCGSGAAAFSGITIKR